MFYLDLPDRRPAADPAAPQDPEVDPSRRVRVDPDPAPRPAAQPAPPRRNLTQIKQVIKAFEKYTIILKIFSQKILSFLRSKITNFFMSQTRTKVETGNL